MAKTDLSAIQLLANITRHRSRLSVESALLENVYQFLDCQGVTLLRLNHRLKENHVIACFPLNKATHSGLSQHVSSANISSRPDLVVVSDLISMVADLGVHQLDPGAKIAFFPAIISEWLTDIVCITSLSPELNNEQLQTLAAVISVYSNFIHILEEGERDVLTGLLNRKTFDSRIDNLLTESYLTQRPNILAVDKQEERKAFDQLTVSHWIGVLDIDFFKNINDQYGHIYGDEVLILFSKLMRDVFRNNDLLFRFGGEEFVVFLLNIDESGAETAFERFRYEVEHYNFPQVGSVTVSIGLTCMQEGNHTATILDQADKALYYAKEHGRNKVCNYSSLMKRGLLEKISVKDNIDLF
jgi:diguanylate cyclase (GGDEF)-like protein